MKLFYKRPTKALRMVKPDRDSPDYEFWVLVPVKIGGARKVSSNRVITDDGAHTPNLAVACQHFLEGKEGNAELINELKVWRASSRRSEPKLVTGLDLVAQNKWNQFCRVRGINMKSIDALQASYELTRAEISELGLANDKNSDL
jgi:hypothetical protein